LLSRMTVIETARDPEHDNTPAGWARAAITISNNPKCKDVVDYLSALPKMAAT
jgi:hypothetical protein